MKTMISRFAKDESGATAIEYGLIATLIGVAIIAAATTVGTKLNAIFDYIADQARHPGVRQQSAAPKRGARDLPWCGLRAVRADYPARTARVVWPPIPISRRGANDDARVLLVSCVTARAAPRSNTPFIGSIISVAVVVAAATIGGTSSTAVIGAIGPHLDIERAPAACARPRRGPRRPCRRARDRGHSSDPVKPILIIDL